MSPSDSQLPEQIPARDMARSVDAFSLTPSNGTPIGYYSMIAKRNGWTIFGAVAITLALTYGVSSLMTPVYEATATVDIDLRTPIGVLGNDSHQVSTPDADQFMATQMKLIQSDSVLRPVVEKYHLLDLEKQYPSTPSLQPVLNNAPVVLKKLRVNRPPNTFLVQISYRSPDREVSSAVANAIAASYIRHTYDLRFQSSQGVSDFMERQLEQLKAKMETSSDKLAAFERDLNVADPDQKTAILSSRLIQLNNEYATAQADRLRREAAFHSMESGSLEAAEVSTQGEALKKLTERLDEAQERFAAVKNLFGKNFPDYKKAALEVEELQTQLNQTRDSISKRVEIEFRQAVNRENMLETAVAGLKKEFDSLNARSFEYQTLKRDAEADKKLYDELEQKIKEAGINAGFQNSSVRLADPARPTLKPIFPDLKLNLLMALCFSLGGSMVLVVAIDRRNTTLRDPETAFRNFRIRVLGNLPLMKGKARVAPILNSATSGKQLAPLDRIMFDEAIQALRSAVLLAPQNYGLRCLAVTSALPGDGKTVTACHLAAANAGMGRRTLLIDFDLRRPQVDRCMGIESSKDLEDVLRGNAPWRSGRRPAGDRFPNLDILSLARGDAELASLAGAAVPLILAEGRKEYDLIVVDSPPLLGFSVPLDIAACADGVLLIAVAGQTDSRLIARCIAMLRQVGAENLGLVLNKVTARNSEYGYYGNYLKHYKRYSGVN
ncbi:MAG: AAA family ATPase [Bryobacteraceae bacterium]|jgi:capsular exopolysaccharide synthesis family protein